MLQGSQWHKGGYGARALAFVCAPAFTTTESAAEYLTQFNTFILTAYVLENDPGPHDALAIPECFVTTSRDMESRGEMMRTDTKMRASEVNIV